MSLSFPFAPAGFISARLRHSRLWLALLAGLMTNSFARAATTESAPRLEYQVKAGYLFNFLRFTDWPPQALPAGAPFRIGVVGDNAAFTVISEALHGKSVNNRAIEIVFLPSAETLQGYHLVFVPRTVELAAPTTDVNPPEGVLMVGESNDYALRDGMIGFVQRGHNIRFQVNLSAAQRAGLKLSGRLASLAEIVQSR